MPCSSKRCTAGACRGLRPSWAALSERHAISPCDRARACARNTRSLHARAYAEHLLGRLFTHAGNFGLQPPRLLLATVGLKRSDLREHDDVLSVDAAVRAADRSQVVVAAL